MAAKPILQTHVAEHVRRQIGSPLFAIEANLQTLKGRLKTDGGNIFDGFDLVASMEKSIETIKARLHELDVAEESEVKFETFDPEDGIAMLTIEEFRQQVIGASLVNDDGSGYLMTTTLDSTRILESNQQVCLSDIKSGKPLPAWATHVAWYNK